MFKKFFCWLKDKLQSYFKEQKALKDELKKLEREAYVSELKKHAIIKGRSKSKARFVKSKFNFDLFSGEPDFLGDKNKGKSKDDDNLFSGFI